MRFHERVLNIKWKKGTKRPDKSNAIDLLVSGQLPKDGPEREAFEASFEEVPPAFTDEERESWMKQLKDVCVSSDAFVSAHHAGTASVFTADNLLVPLHRQRLPRRPLRRQVHGRPRWQPERRCRLRDGREAGHYLCAAEHSSLPPLKWGFSNWKSYG